MTYYYGIVDRMSRGNFKGQIALESITMEDGTPHDLRTSEWVRVYSMMGTIHAGDKVRFMVKEDVARGGDAIAAYAVEIFLYEPAQCRAEVDSTLPPLTSKPVDSRIFEPAPTLPLADLVHRLKEKFFNLKDRKPWKRRAF